MKLAYLIVAHKNPEQMKRLFRAIFHPQHYYAFHVARHAPAECHQAARSLADQVSNASVTASKYCRWGGYSLVEAELLGMQHLLNYAHDWDFFINVSGQDFPLCSQETITSYLSDKRGWNFLEYFDPMTTWEDAQRRKTKICLELPLRKDIFLIPGLRIDTDFLLGNAQWYGGSPWCILSREAVAYLAKSKALRKYKLFARYRCFPCEFFVQTVLMNSEHREQVFNDNKRHIIWAEGDNHPKILTVADYAELTQSTAFFARKFDPSVDSAILDLLEQRICPVQQYQPQPQAVNGEKRPAHYGA